VVLPARVLGVLAVVGALLAPVGVAPADAATVHCVGYDSCAAQGFPNAGYAAASQRSYWNMVTGHNCTNYVAFRVVGRGGPGSRPWDGSGDAHRWGHELPGSTDQTPIVGAVAWWDSFTGGWGENGHVAYVERVLSPTTIQVSEDVFNGDFRWRTISRGEAAWPTGFIHLVDERIRGRGAAPRISGVPRVGEVLTSSPGSWEPGGVDLTYQWLADGRRVRGATSPSLTLEPKLVGAAMSVEVTAEQVGYLPASVRTSASNPVRLGRIRQVREPRIRGRALVGQVLTVDPGRTRPEARATYRWLADGKVVRGVTSPRLQLTSRFTGARIAVRVTLRQRGYESLEITSRLPERVARNQLRRVTSPRIVGAPRVGSTLEVIAARWSVPPARRAYVWFADDEAIEGEYGPRLLLRPSLVGRTIVVVEGATRPGYAAGVSASVPVGPVTG